MLVWRIKMFKGLGNLVEQAQKMQGELKKIQESLASKTVEASVGGGMVRVVVNGRHEVVSIQIDPELMKMNDQNMLQDLIRAGVNQANSQAQALIQQEMAGLTAGLGPLANMFRGGGDG